jgi:hypothetical protein
MKKIYIANLAKYVEGKLVGEWINLPNDEEYIRQKISDILGYNEEIAIHDYEDIPFEIHEYDDIYNINNLLKFFEDNKIPDDVIEHMIDTYQNSNKYDLKNYEELDYYILYDIHDYADLAYAMWKELGYYAEITEAVEQYIDWEKIGMDLNCGGEWILTKNNTAIIVYS